MSIGELNGLDYLFLAIIVISTALGLKRGLAREFISVIALVAGFVLAALFYKRAAFWLAGLTRTEVLAQLLGFLAIFFGTLALGAIVSFMANRFIKATALAWFDRALGGAYGLVRGWAIGSIMVFALVAFPVRHEIVSRSAVAPFLLAGARAAVAVVPVDLRNRFRIEYKKVLEAWNTHRSAK